MPKVRESTGSDRLVFVDIDGVLAPFQSEAPFCPACVTCLNEIVERTGASIVITSSWRERASVDELREWFRRAGFRGVIVGVTPILLGRSRGAEVHAYLGELDRTGVFIIVDDQADMDAKLRERLVLVDGDIGLRASDVDRALVLMRCAR